MSAKELLNLRYVGECLRSENATAAFVSLCHNMAEDEELEAVRNALYEIAEDAEASYYEGLS